MDAILPATVLAMVAQINRLWRLLATGFGFLLFGIVGFCFNLGLTPWARRKNVGLAQQKRIRRFVTASWRYFSYYLVLSGIVKVEFQGFERLGRAGQLILANHPSLLDVVFILSRLPEANCIVKADLLNNPAMANQIRACGFVPNEESLEFVDKVHDILQKECLLIFPEGTRTGWDGKIAFHRGAVSIGLRSAAVITPIIVKMSPPNWKKAQPWYHIPLRRPRYQFIVGEDINPQDWLAEKPLPIAARRLNDFLQNYFNERTAHERVRN